MLLVPISALGELWGCASAVPLQGEEEVVFLWGRPRQAASRAAWWERTPNPEGQPLLFLLKGDDGISCLLSNEEKYCRVLDMQSSIWF